MKLTLSELVPAVSAWLEGISSIPLVQSVNQTPWIFAIIETVHLLFLAILGGAVFALNLRLLGIALRGVPAKEVERVTRPWFLAGVVGTSLTGIAMSLTSAKTLMPNPAFFVKMVALLAAILLSAVVAQQVRRHGDVRSGAANGLGVGAAGLWLVALLLFATTRGLASGSVLIALSGVALAATLLVRHRKLSLRRNLAPVQLGAFASTLAWITVAAAGRWIGFS